MDLRITLKFVKQKASTAMAVDLQPNAHAFTVIDEEYSVNNEAETILCLIVTRDRLHQLTFDLLQPVRRVILEGEDLTFETSSSELTLNLPMLSANRDRSADMYMIIPFTGVELRLEVGRPNQSAGKYREDSFPHAARDAATTVEFALIEAVQALKLDKEIGLGSLGPIYIMGFDTNNPCGHTDWPPHIHLHMAKPLYGAPIGHYYFDDELRFSHNNLYLRKIETEIKRFNRNDICSHYTPDGTLLFALTITVTGGLTLTSINNESVMIEPTENGFNTGAMVSYGAITKKIKAQIDDDTGIVKVIRDDRLTTYSFDKDTGTYLGVTDNNS